VTLLNTNPPVWRRILVPDTLTLADLHTAVQISMGWTNSHLHAFRVGDRRYADPSIIDGVGDEQQLALNTLVQSGVTRFEYNYDFGDDWEHEILIETAPPADKTKPRPACVDGRRACPPEDCGGPWAYADLLDVLADPAHPQHQEQLEWFGADFDPEAFSVADADAALASAFARTKRSRS
jgi:hypothetical protein